MCQFKKTKNKSEKKQCVCVGNTLIELLESKKKKKEMNPRSSLGAVCRWRKRYKCVINTSL